MKTRLKTNFETGAIPLSEYPRPQFARASYATLNGEWNYAIILKGEKLESYNGKILVPFSPESLLSGLDKQVIVRPNNELHYQKTFNVEESFINDKTILHFGAVDYICSVYINDKLVGKHRGGYTAFSFDISKAIKAGENDIKLTVTDPSDTSHQSIGKQRLKPFGIYYTPQSGIWQSVWMESIPKTYLNDITIVPNIDNNTINLKLDMVGTLDSEITIFDGEKKLYSQKHTGQELSIKLEKYELWSPENPKLYDLEIKVGDDSVKSYFGMRKFSYTTDSKGFKRLALNNKPYFHTGVLDQGYWSDGMLTPPSNEALEYDVKLMKDMHFNCLRKHIKIEPMLWYYYCDKHGILVWQDMINGGTGAPMFTTVLAPNARVYLKDSWYFMFGRTSKENREEFMTDMRDTVNQLKNCVSLAMWVPFNEAWGQFDSVKVTNILRKIDDTRTIDSVSGWHDQGKKSSDCKSLHIYFRPFRMPLREKRCVLLSEFGGYSIPVEGHRYSSKIFGYKRFTDLVSFQKAFDSLYTKQITPAIKKGLSATIYTQVSDIENEINGLITYDRKVIKVPVELAARLNDQLKIED